jgi:hypothetical protein
VYQNKRSTGLSRLETLPSILLRKISLLLDDEVDEICLSLASKGVAATMRQFCASATRSWCYRCGSNHRDCHEDDDDERSYDWYELAMRLEGWIPASQRFCHHCLVFLPTFCFGSPILTIDELVCLDCLRLKQQRRPPDVIECAGCLVVQTQLDWEEGAQEDNDHTCSVVYRSDNSISGEDVENQEDAEDQEKRYVEERKTVEQMLVTSSREGRASTGLTNAGVACLCT